MKQHIERHQQSTINTRCSKDQIDDNRGTFKLKIENLIKQIFIDIINSVFKTHDPISISFPALKIVGMSFHIHMQRQKPSNNDEKHSKFEFRKYSMILNMDTIIIKHQPINRSIQRCSYAKLSNAFNATCDKQALISN